jgi:hypothetical protein
VDVDGCFTILWNQPPVISSADGSLGVKNGAFTFPYTVTDPDGDVVSVTEAINGEKIRVYNPTLGQPQNMEVAGADWVKLPNGNHTLTITATDPLNKTVRTMIFTKSIDSCGFTLAQDKVMQSIDRPARMIIDVFREVAAGAVFSMEVCNNGNDAVPTWEDATTAAIAGLAYVFKNEQKTADAWGVNIRVRLERNNAVGNCRIYSAGGFIE